MEGRGTRDFILNENCDSSKWHILNDNYDAY